MRRLIVFILISITLSSVTTHANHVGLFFARRTAGVKNFGSYRAWGDGSFGSSCLSYINPSEPRYHYYNGATGTGVYRIKVAGVISDVTCDMTTHGGGYQQVATLDPTKVLSGKQFIVSTSEYGPSAGTNPGSGSTIVGFMGKPSSGLDNSYNQITTSTNVYVNGSGGTPGTGSTEMYNYLSTPLWYGNNGVSEDFTYVIYSSGEVVRRIFSCSCGSGERSYFYFRVLSGYTIWEHP